MKKRRATDHELSHYAESTYATTDLDLVAFLTCREIEPRDVRPPLPHTFPNFATFVLVSTSTLEDALADWASGKPLVVDLREFLSKRRALYRQGRSLRESGS